MNNPINDYVTCVQKNEQHCDKIINDFFLIKKTSLIITPPLIYDIRQPIKEKPCMKDYMLYVCDA